MLRTPSSTLRHARTGARCCRRRSSHDEVAEIAAGGGAARWCRATRPARARRSRRPGRARWCWRWWCGWSSRLSPIAASWPGSTRTRTAGCSAPLTLTSRDAGHLRDALRDDGVGDVVERARLQRRRGQRQDQDRRRGFGFALRKRRQGRQVARQVDGGRVERGLHVARRARRCRGTGRTGCRCPSGPASSTTRSRSRRRSRRAGAPAARRPWPPSSRGRRRAGSPDTWMVGSSTDGRLATGRK